MSLRSLLGGNPGGGDKEHELSELKNKYSSLLKTSNDRKVEYERAIGSRANDKEEIATLRQNASFLEGRIAILEKELQACTDDLFRLQPMVPIADSTITQRFETLDDLIRDWIDTEISRFMDKWESRSQGARPKLFHDNGEVLTRNFLAEYPDTGGEYILRYVFHGCLHKWLFGEGVFLFGLRTDNIAFLERIEDGMMELVPPREPATIQAWRSETLSSLARSSAFWPRINKAKARLTNALFESLEVYFPVISGSETSLRTLYENVVTHAVELGIAMQTSTTSYKVEPRMSAVSLFQRGSVSMDCLRSARMVDVATGKSLKPDSPVWSDENENIGEFIMVLTPGLCRYDRGKGIVLSQQVILIRLYQPLGRRRARTVESS